MAKRKKQTQQEPFFESLSAMLPTAAPAAEGLDQLWGRAKQRWQLINQVVQPLATAAIQDVRYVSHRLATTVTSRAARRLYSVVTVLSLTATVAIGALIASTTYAVYGGDLSSPNVLLNKKNTGTTILDRNGNILYQVYGAANRELMSVNELPVYLKKATLAAEDPDFYNHPGFSMRATIRAALHNASNESLQGGSTITQQLVKNALLSPDRNYLRKFQEILLATELERRYAKDEILQMYLNEVYYGQGALGIGSAAQTYFHKPATQLSLSESALLAGLPLGPSRFDPNVDPEAARERRDFILARMESLGYISPAEATAAKAEPIVAHARQIDIKAPHFVFYVLDELRKIYGDDLVERGGISVTTSLDMGKQTIGEQAVRDQVARLGRNGASNGALVALNPENGEILAMVGSVNYFEPTFGRVNVTTSLQQPGSSFKPIAYAAAFQKGWNGATKVDDKPISLPGGDGTIYRPRNYDGRFRGPVLLRRALANSLNIPAIEVIRYAGVNQTIELARAMGISTLTDPSRYGVSLVLGGGDVRPLDMASAYGVLANNGQYLPSKAILKVQDKNGRDITKKTAESKRQVLDPRIAFMITDILSDNNARAEVFGTNSALKLPFPAAAKTGTTNDYRDNWTVGYTPGLVTAVWIGNNDNRAMDQLSGSIGAAPIWNRFMVEALRGQPVRPFVAPAGVTQLAVCATDGGLANPWDKVITEYFPSEARPTRRCQSQAPKPPEDDKPKEDKDKEGSDTEPNNNDPQTPTTTEPTRRFRQPED